MAIRLLVIATIIIACILFNKISTKLGIPALLAFILLGMFFGSDGIIKIDFDNYLFTEQISTVALIFIMFYGGFGTNYTQARPVMAKSILLSSVGTVMTAALVGLFCHYVLKIKAAESFLIGSVISSTDAASVFSILRSKHLNLRYNTASLLEVESGSNDPFSYMLTVVCLAFMNNGVSAGNVVFMLFSQIVIGVICGFALSQLAFIFMKKYKFCYAGLDTIFMVAAALISYALPAAIGGNGYLSVYICGIVLGNRKIENKKALVNFFDGVTALMQMLLFFLLGLLSSPSRFAEIAPYALAIALFLTFVARPFAVFSLLLPFKSKLGQCAVVSWSGLRGAASIVFAILAVLSPAVVDNDIFHIVFFIVLFSILIQGSLIPLISKKLNMTDDSQDVMKTFNDYLEEVPVQFMRFIIPPHHPWEGLAIKSITFPPDSLLVLILRENKKIIPTGKTILHAYDTLILSGLATDHIEGVNLYERVIEKSDELNGVRISDIPPAKMLVIMIRRGEHIIIPRGSTRIKENDILVINEADD